MANIKPAEVSKILGEKLKPSGEQAKLIDNYLKEIDFKKN